MAKDKKIKTGIDKIDEVLSSGLTKGDLSVFIANPNMGKTSRVLFLPSQGIEPIHREFYSREMADKVTEKGQCLLCDTIKLLKENGFDTSGIKMSKTTHEKIGDTVFPVTYFPNGMIFVDYPTQPLRKKDNDNSTGSTD